MLARRFTIVCLVMTLFGMLLSIVVAEAGKSPRRWISGELMSCLVKDGVQCRPVGLDGR